MWWLERSAAAAAAAAFTPLTLHPQQTPQRRPPWGDSLRGGRAFPANKDVHFTNPTKWIVSFAGGATLKTAR